MSKRNTYIYRRIGREVGKEGEKEGGEGGGWGRQRGGGKEERERKGIKGG